MNKKEYIKAQIAIGVLCAALSFAVVLQYKSVKSNMKNVTLTSEQERIVLREENAALKEKNADLALQMGVMQNDIEEYRNAAEKNGDYEAALTGQLRRAEALAGLSSLSGQGVKIVLSDSSATGEGAVEEFIIHDSDLRLVITELAAAGAEAISINGQRIVAMSAVRCVGPVITINEVKTAPPFEILAIGDKKTLEAAVNMRGGIADLFANYKIDLQMTTLDEIKIPRYTGVFRLNYAQTDMREENN